jgi:hypothetical protein
MADLKDKYLINLDNLDKILEKRSERYRGLAFEGKMKYLFQRYYTYGWREAVVIASFVTRTEEALCLATLMTNGGVLDLPNFDLIIDQFSQFDIASIKLHGLILHVKTLCCGNESGEMSAASRKALQGVEGIIENEPVWSSWVNGILSAPVPRLRSLSVECSVKPDIKKHPDELVIDEKFVKLCHDNADGLTSLELDGLEKPIQLHWFNNMTKLTRFVVKSPVLVESVTKSNAKHEYFTGLKNVIELVLKDCSMVKCFLFLSGFTSVQSVVIEKAPYLTCNDLSPIVNWDKERLQYLRVAETSIIHDELLKMLLARKVGLVHLSAPCTGNEVDGGFSNKWLRKFLECRQNSGLGKLNLSGHRNITKDIFGWQLACYASIFDLDLRYTSVSDRTKMGLLARERHRYAAGDKCSKGGEDGKVRQRFVPHLTVHMTVDPHPMNIQPGAEPTVVYFKRGKISVKSYRA